MQNHLSFYCLITLAVVSIITLLSVIYTSEFIYKGKTSQDFITAFPKQAKRMGIFFLVYLLTTVALNTYQGEWHNFSMTLFITGLCFVIITTLDTIRII